MLVPLVLGCGAGQQRLASVDLRTALYQDTDQTTVGTATVAARAHPSDETTVAARYLLDVTTSASVDVVSAATGRWDEARHEVMGGGGWNGGESAVNASYVYSIENDWASHTGSLSGSFDFDQHNLTLQWGATYGWNDVWRSGDPNFRREQQTVTGTLGLVIVGSPTSLVSLGYWFQWVDGFQESPYRYARFVDPGGSIFLTGPEEVPDARYRHALTVRWNQMVGDAVALRSHARIYGDDWGIASLTLGTELRGRVDETDLGWSVRLYGQLGASFWHDVYPSQQRYMSSDRELSPFVDVFAGPFVSYRLGSTGDLDELRLEARATGFAFHFFEFARLSERFGLVAELALGASW